MQIFILLCDINTIVLHPDPKGVTVRMSQHESFSENLTSFFLLLPTSSTPLSQLPQFSPLVTKLLLSSPVVREHGERVSTQTPCLLQRGRLEGREVEGNVWS